MSGNEALLTFEESSALDERTQAAGFSEIQLMGNAALASLHAFQAGPPFRRMIILAGSGNNGGDGYALAFMFASSQKDFRERLVVLRLSDRMTPAAAFYAEKLTSIGGRVEDAAVLGTLAPGREDLLVDAILGTGQKESPRGRTREILNEIRLLRARADRPRYASLDVPTGLVETAYSDFSDNDTGVPLPDEIHCYGDVKLSVALHSVLAGHSRILSLPIGFLPRGATFAERFPRVEISECRKTPEMHKYTAGHGLLVGGADGMQGAILLAARSFFAAGGGILHARSLSQEEGALRKEISVMWIDHVTKTGRVPGAVGCGPGFGSEGFAQVAEEIISFLKDPALASSRPGIVLDAAACAFALEDAYPAELRDRTILTPHGGEWKSLGGPPVQCVSDLKSAAEWNAKTLGVWTLVKGSVSVLLPPRAGEPVRVHSLPNPALATAGSGDCLTGILTAVLARGPRPMPEVVSLSIQLLDAAARKVVHPSASIFPDLIRGCLGDNYLPIY